MRILIIDDDDSFRELLAEIVSRLGHAAVCAASGNEALELLGKQKINLVIVDYEIPGVSGAELIQAIQAGNPGLAVVIISGYDLSAILEEFPGLKIRDFLLKPVDFEKFEKLIGSIAIDH